MFLLHCKHFRYKLLHIYINMRKKDIELDEDFFMTGKLLYICIIEATYIYPHLEFVKWNTAVIT